MLSKFPKAVRHLFIACFLLAAAPASAQNSYHNIIFKIDSLIDVGLPKSALAEVKVLDALARKENNTPQIVRSVLYRLKLQTYLEDDALVNVINSLKADIGRSAFPVKPILQSFLADMYWRYYQDNRYKFANRSRLEKPDVDFRNWDLATLIDETTRLYNLSLQEAEKEQKTPVDILDGILTGDKRFRNLRPTLYDILLHRSFDYFLADEAAITRPKAPFTLNDARFFSDAKTFVQIPITTTDTGSTWYRGIKFMQQGIAFHLQKNNGKATADLDLQRLKFIYTNSSLSNKDTLYVTALKSIAADPSAGDFGADALYTIGSHYNDIENFTAAMVYLNQAIAAYPKSFGAINSHNLINQIRTKSLSGMIEDVNPPDKPILSYLTYRNVEAARYNIYYVTAAQIALMTKMDKHDGDLQPGKQTLAYLRKLKAVQDKTISLPGYNDYKEHTTEFKIDALSKGAYLLLLQQASAKNSLVQLQTFNVSGLAYSTRTLPDGRREIRVVNRETGELIKGATVTATYDPGYRGNVKLKPIVAKGLTNANGAFIFSLGGTTINIGVSYNGDQPGTRERNLYNTATTARLKKDSVLTTLLFTDRQIYRPGQTIYFKALKVLNVDGKGNIVPNTPLEVEFRGTNGKELAKLSLKTNEFGSAAASFVIPQNILNGQVYLTTPNGLIRVTIAEYKRPTFSVSFEPFTQNLKLNDTVTVKGKVDAFSGYGLSAARVAYRVTYTRNNMADNRRPRSFVNYNNEVAADTIQTDGQGKFEFKFLAASPLSNDPDIAYTYNINADVSDANGETQPAGTYLSLSNKAMQLEVSVPEMVMPDAPVDANIMLYNAAKQAQSGKAIIEVYALKSPAEFFKTRLWGEPDKWLMSRDEYHKYFPGFAYDGEDDHAKWQRLQKISSQEISLQNAGAGHIDLNKLLGSPYGVYAVVVSATSESGDTASVVKYITNIKEDAPVQNSENWVQPVSTTIKPGQPAEFFVGINKNCRVLLETFDEDKLLSSRLVALNAGPAQKINIPVPATKRNSFSVQFALINSNRQFNYYQRILVADTVKPLNIRFLTMRDKLQPGAKEEWKLEITGSDDSQASELLAGMYDASLDDVAGPASWQYPGAHIPYIEKYFEWDTEPISSAATTVSDYKYDYSPPDNDYTNTTINYEGIDMLGFNYYGTDNDSYSIFQQTVRDARLSARGDKKIAARYRQNAALVTNGYDVIGKVLGGNMGLGGVKVRINNSAISTVTNSRGYFKIKVPVNAMLVFSAGNWETRKLSPPKGLRLIVRMRSLAQVQYEMMNASPGFKDQKGDPNADIRIDEPVGNADVKQVVENDVLAYYAPPVAKASGYASLKLKGQAGGAKAMMYDELYDEKLRKKAVSLKEIRIPPKPVTIRKNFNETAFFYPQLRTDEKGQVTIGFTIPEALTKWKFRGVAYNQKMQTGYIEQTVITQKQLMISANMPRFLREEDTLVVSARVVNLSPGALKGEAKLELFDALTLKPVNLFAKGDNGMQRFTADSATTKAVSFKLIIPAGLEALTYRLTASAGDYTDGEENTLPVLPNRMPVTETMPMMVRAGQTKTFHFDKLLNQNSNTLQNKTLTLEYTQNPVWPVVQALPYMMEFPYECSEQLFSRLYANNFATFIVNSNPKIKQVFDRWKATDSKELLSNLEKNQELKSILLEETPWLQDAANETEQKKRIAQLFDLNKMNYELKENMAKLEKKQLPNGAFPWFGGNYPDRYITQHIVAGIGQLNKLAIAGEISAPLKSISTRAVAYLDKQLVEDEANQKKYDKKYQTRNLDDIEIHAWYARSYFKDAKVAGELMTGQKNYLARSAAQWTSRSEYEKAMIALTLYRNGDKETAANIIKSLTETARQSDELGMYWATNTYGYYWYQAPIETQSLMIELFTEAANNPAAVAEMKIWLLRNKQTNNWQTTKATAAACYALLVKGGDALADAGSADIRVGGKPIAELKPEIKAEAGSGYLKTTWVEEQIKPGLGNVQVANTGKTINWGALYWQYTERMDKVTPSNTNVQLERKYFIKKQTNSGPLLVAVDATHLPKTGDVLKVVIHLKADRDFDYIHLKDMRPAGTEPINSLSEYKYQDGLYYYQATKDVATNFFFSSLNKGTYVFEYELRVVQPGNYATGITSLQSMYAPEFNAHSDGGRITFVP